MMMLPRTMMITIIVVRSKCNIKVSLSLCIFGGSVACLLH